MRSLLAAVLCLLGGSLALAEGTPPGEDDERPGERSAPDKRSRRQPIEEGHESDTPPSRGVSSAPQPIDSAPGDRAADERRRGDSPLRLDGQRGRQVEGVYAGVAIGGAGLPPKPPKLPMKGPQRMTWPGFQVREGVPTVFLQTTGTPDYVVSDRGDTVLVTLRGTTIKLRNNQRPLRVGEFGTDVTEVTAKPRGRDVLVTIKRKGGGPHRERVEASAGGYQLLLVELPGK